MEENNQDKIYYINVDDILPNRFQPRLAFDEKELNELANSILKYGIIQPIVLRKIRDKYEIIAGERRYKAACLAGLKTVPAIINNTDDNTSAEIALLENLQRKNLTVIEEAQSYKKLMDKGFTQEDIANKLGVSQSSIANKLRLLNLPKEVRDALLYNQISERHARSLLSLNNEDLQKSLLNKIINDKLTVKQTEDEISMLLMKDMYKRQESDIPQNIQRFLNPQQQVVKNEQEPKKEVEEFLQFNIPSAEKLNENVNNNENNSSFKQIISNEESINPFVKNNDVINPSVLDKQDSNYGESLLNITNDYNSNNTENNYISPFVDFTNENIVTQTSNISSVIDEVKKLVEKLNSEGKKVRTTELDLNNKYQIIIEIEKDAN